MYCVNVVKSRSAQDVLLEWKICKAIEKGARDGAERSGKCSVTDLKGESQQLLGVTARLSMKPTVMILIAMKRTPATTVATTGLNNMIAIEP